MNSANNSQNHEIQNFVVNVVEEDTTTDFDDQKSKTRKWKSFCKKNLLDFLLVALVTTYLYLSNAGIFTTGTAMIQCLDPKLQYPYMNDTISNKTLLAVSAFVPLLSFFLLEWVHLRKSSPLQSYRPALRRAWSFFISFLIGGLLTYTMVEFLKTFVSEPRPHFMNSCKPNLTAGDCQETWVKVSYEDCQNPLQLSLYKLIDTMKSFPSGHACLGLYVSLVMILYLRERLRFPLSRALLPCAQILWAVWGLTCAVSRVTDHKHHWWDVLAGGCIGLLCGYFTVSYFCNWFNVSSTPKTKVHNAQTLSR